MAGNPDFPVAPAPFSGRARVVEAGACFDWLRQGWALFAAEPGNWLAATVLLLIGFFALFVVPLLGQFAANLLMPVLAAGMLEFCRQQSAGEKLRLESLFAGFQKNSGGLVLVGLIYTLAMLAVSLVIGVLVGGSLAGGLLLGNVAGVGMFLGGILLGGLLGLVLMVPVLMAVLFAPALVFFHAMPPVEAMKASFNACAANWLAMLVYLVLLFVLAFFAALPLGLGFLILIPVATGATYAAYRDIFPAS